MVNVEQYYEIIQKPLLTEKSSNLQETRNQYTFRVHPKTNKSEVRKAVEAIFDVQGFACEHHQHAEQAAPLPRPSGPGTSPWKKAIVTLRDGHTIDFT